MSIFFLYFFYLIHLALSDCSNGTIQSPNKNCYKIFTQPSTWYLAETACIQSGGHLASIQDVFTNAYLVGIADEGLNGDDYWIGGTTNFRGGNWSWSDFKSFSYTNWLKGQPNTNIGYCASQRLSDASWTSSPCTEQKPYICEYPPQQTPVTCPSPCPSEWLYVNSSNNCYKGASLYLNWTAALNYCQNTYQATLPSIHSAKENQIINSIDFVSNTTHQNYYWLGLHDPYNNGTYQWLDGSPVDYVNWNPAHINQLGFCTILASYDLTWWKWACNDQDHTIYIICQKSAWF